MKSRRDLVGLYRRSLQLSTKQMIDRYIDIVLRSYDYHGTAKRSFTLRENFVVVVLFFIQP